MISKIRATADGFSAFAPSPYTVSVGTATTPPDRNRSTAVSTSVMTTSMPARSSGPPTELDVIRRDGVEEIEHGVDERERLRCREMIGVAQLHVSGVGERVDECVGGLGEIMLAERHEHGTGDAAHIGGFDGPGIGPSQHGRERESVVALDVRVLAEETSEVVVRFGRALDPGEDPCRGRVVALEDVAPDAGEHDAMEAVRGSDRRPQQRQRAEREPDRVDRVVGERGDDAGGQVGVLRRVMWLGRGTVAERRRRSPRGRRRPADGKPLRSHVDANQPPHPCTRTTGTVTVPQRRAGAAAQLA